MRGAMRGAVLFLSGIIVGAGLMASVAAQGTLNTGAEAQSRRHFRPELPGDRQLLRKGHGLPRVPPVRAEPGRPAGHGVRADQPRHLHRNCPGRADAKPTITHIGVGADDIKATVARVNQNGGKATEPRRSANSGSILANITDPAGIRTELNEQPPGSMMRQAIDSWK